MFLRTYFELVLTALVPATHLIAYDWQGQAAPKTCSRMPVITGNTATKALQARTADCHFATITSPDRLTSRGGLKCNRHD